MDEFQAEPSGVGDGTHMTSVLILVHLTDENNIVPMQDATFDIENDDDDNEQDAAWLESAASQEKSRESRKQREERLRKMMDGIIYLISLSLFRAY